MQKSKIEWLQSENGSKGYSVNPIKGICKMQCSYCYAIRMYRRFNWDPEIRYDHSAFNGIEKIKAGSKVFLCSTHDMFGPWIPSYWIENILGKVLLTPQITFICLTKNPQEAMKYHFPKNVWLGVTVESQEQVWRIKTLLQPEIKASLKFVSFEPLHSEIHCDFNNHLLGKENQKISWFIIGAETGNRKDKIIAKHDWVTSLLYEHADTPAFLKNNLKYCLQGCNLYQEYPKDAP